MKNTKAFCLLLSLLVSACATQPPVAEVRLVAKSFDQLNAASQPLLDDLAVAERAQGKSAALERAKTRSTDTTPTPSSPGSRCPSIILIGGELPGTPAVQNGFCAEDSYYYSDLVDPPATLTFRRALAAIGDYTGLLLILAEGRNLEEAKAQLGALAANISAPLALAGAPGVGPALRGALKAFEPLIELGAKASNNKELERIVRADAPKVQALIAALQMGADELFKTLTEGPLAQFNTTGLKNAELAKVEAGRIENYRAAISNYTVLLDQYRSLLGELVESYDRPQSSVTLANLAEHSAQLSAQADAWRRSLANSRSGLR